MNKVSAIQSATQDSTRATDVLYLFWRSGWERGDHHVAGGGLGRREDRWKYLSHRTLTNIKLFVVRVHSRYFPFPLHENFDNNVWSPRGVIVANQLEFLLGCSSDSWCSLSPTLVEYVPTYMSLSRIINLCIHYIPVPYCTSIPPTLTLYYIIVSCLVYIMGISQLIWSRCWYSY